MANEVQLGIDIDTKDLAAAIRLIDKFNKELKETANAGQQAARGSNAAARSEDALARASQNATRQQERYNDEMSRTTRLFQGVQRYGNLAKGALAGFVASQTIRSLQQTAGTMQRIDLTFQSVTGSAAAAQQQMAYVAKTADGLGQSVETSALGYAKLLAASDAANIPLQDTRNIFEGLTAASTAFGLSQYELEGALTAVQQMISKGSVQSEELKGQLGERLPGAFSIAAAAMGMTVGELSKALEQGKVSAEEFVAKFGPELQRRYGAFAAGADTAARSINELENATFQLKKVIIEGGFLSALAKVLGAFTQLAASEGAVTMAQAIGDAFLWVAENTDKAAIGMAAAAGIAAMLGAPFTAVALGVGALSLAFIELVNKTVMVGDTMVPVADIIVATWNEVVRTFEGFGFAVFAYVDAVRKVLTALADYVINIWGARLQTALETVTGWWDAASEGVLNFVDTSKGYFSKFLEILSATLTKIKEFVNNFIGLFAGIPMAVFEILKAIPQIVIGIFSEAGALAAAGVGALWEAIKSGSTDGFKQTMADAAKEAFSNVEQIARDAGSDVSEAFNAAFEKDFVGAAGNAIAEQIREDFDHLTNSFNGSVGALFEKIDAGYTELTSAEAALIQEIANAWSISLVQITDTMGNVEIDVLASIERIKQAALLAAQAGAEAAMGLDPFGGSGNAPPPAAGDRTSTSDGKGDKKGKKGGGPKESAFEKEQKKLLEDLADAQRDLNVAQTEGVVNLEKYRRAREVIKAAEESGVTLTKEQTQAIYDQVDALRAARDATEALTRTKEAWEDLGETIQDTTVGAAEALGGALGAAVAAGESLGDTLDRTFREVGISALQDFGTELAKVLTQQALLAAGFGGGDSAGQSIGASLAKGIGGLFSGGGFDFAMAKGGVIEAPTIARTSSGALGQIGEAGPEAVLPLTRTAGGQLGVASSGGGGSPTINVINNGNDQVEVRDNGGGQIDIIIAAARKAIENDIARGGNTLSDTLSNSYGLKRAGR